MALMPLPYQIVFRSPLSLLLLLPWRSLPQIAVSSSQTRGTSLATRMAETNGHGCTSSNRGRSHSSQWCHSPCCQICQMDSHFANRCNQPFARSEFSARLNKAFIGSCSLREPEASDWFLGYWGFSPYVHWPIHFGLVQSIYNKLGLSNCGEWCLPTHYTYWYPPFFLVVNSEKFIQNKRV